MSLDLPTLTETVATWADQNPHVAQAYLFGSRVRGDHHPNSDLDVCALPPSGGISTECLQWWRLDPEVRFESLRLALLPVQLHIAWKPDDPTLEWMRSVAFDIDRIVLRVRKVICVLTPRHEATGIS